MKDENETQRINRDQLVTVGDLELFRKSLIDELKQLISSSSTSDKKWLRSAEVRKLLSISAGTLQNFRINRLLPFSRIGKLVFYKYEDVEKLIAQKRK